MKYLKKFESFKINEGMTDLDAIKTHILTEDEIKSLFSLEEDNLAPGESFSEEEYQDFIKDVSGKTIWEYCNWRYPEEPEEQLEMVIGVLELK